MELDFTKPENLQTRDGRQVRIYSTDHVGGYPVVGAIDTGSGWSHTCWMMNGRNHTCAPCDADLIPKPQRVTGWMNAYRSGMCHRTQEEARDKCLQGCIGQIYIDSEVQP